MTRNVKNFQYSEGSAFMSKSRLVSVERTMSPNSSAKRMFLIVCATITELIRRDEHDLSSRQFSIFLTCCIDGPQTIRGLAQSLKVSKPAICQAVDRLEKAELVCRRPDPADHRSVLVHETCQGTALLGDLRLILNAAIGAAPSAYLPNPGR